MATVTKKRAENRKGAVPPPPPPAHEWDQQPKETDLAFASFCVYRDLPPGDRGHAKVAAARNARFPERQPIGTAQIERLSVLWKWPARVRLWDAMIAEKAREGEIDDAVKARREHLQLARDLQSLGKESVANILKAVKSGKGKVSARDAVRAIDSGVKLERLVRGESTENQAQIATTFAEMAQEAERVLKGEDVNSNPHEHDNL